MTTFEREPRTVDTHAGLHSEVGGLASEHRGRATNPVIKVQDLAWLEFEKPDLGRAERFASDFGFAVADRTPEALYLRGTMSSSPCLVIRKGPRSRFVRHVFRAESRKDLDVLARAEGAAVLPERGGWIVTTQDPSGLDVGVTYGIPELPALIPALAQHTNFGVSRTRINVGVRPAKEPARIERLGHVVLETNRFTAALNWYLGTLGMVVSDFLFLDDLRDRGPTMAFLRCDRGSDPADHHTVAMHLGPRVAYVHSAYEVVDLDAVAMGGEYLTSGGYKRVWGIGRHVQGSQIFDYWRDPDNLMFEHFADGDVFDASVEPGWAAMSASGLSQWGPPVTRDFLGTSPTDIDLRSVVSSLHTRDTDIDPRVLRSLMKAMSR